jgi:DNA-directed RNA polymerase subunit RPC12/RpoP
MCSACINETSDAEASTRIQCPNCGANPFRIVSVARQGNALADDDWSEDEMSESESDTSSSESESDESDDPLWERSEADDSEYESSDDNDDDDEAEME